MADAVEVCGFCGESSGWFARLGERTVCEDCFMARVVGHLGRSDVRRRLWGALRSGTLGVVVVGETFDGRKRGRWLRAWGSAASGIRGANGETAWVQARAPE